MSIIPAWILMPVRVKCETRRSLSNGFLTTDDANRYMAKYPEHRFIVLTDD